MFVKEAKNVLFQNTYYLGRMLGTAFSFGDLETGLVFFQSGVSTRLIFGKVPKERLKDHHITYRLLGSTITRNGNMYMHLGRMDELGRNVLSLPLQLYRADYEEFEAGSLPSIGPLGDEEMTIFVKRRVAR